MLRIRTKNKSQLSRSRLKSFDDYVVTLGDVMRGERATLGKSLQDVEQDLRLKEVHLKGIENCDLNAFEIAGFISGYVKSYAKYLKLDPDWAFEKFCEESGFVPFHSLNSKASAMQLAIKCPQFEDEPDAHNPLDGIKFQGPIETHFMDKLNAKALGSSFVLLALIGALGYGAFSVFQQVQRVELTTIDQPAIISSDVEGASFPIDVDTIAQSVENFQPTQESLDRLYRQPALEVPILTLRDGPIADINPDTRGHFAAPPEASAPNERMVAQTKQEALPPSPPPVQVVEALPASISVFAVKEVWLRILAADGTRILEKILAPGENFVLPQTEKAAMLARAGNSGALYFAIDGQVFGPAGKPGEVIKNIELSSDYLNANYTVPPQDADPDLQYVMVQLNLRPTGVVDAP